MKNKKLISPAKILLFSFLIIYSISIIFLLAWAVFTSLKTNREFLIDQNFFGLPKEFAFENYKAVFDNFYVRVHRGGELIYIRMLEQLYYTVIYAGLGCFASAVAPLLVAYACTRFNYKTNVVLTTTVLLSMIIPIVGAQTSMVSVLHELNLFDTLYGAVIMKFNFANIYFLIYIGVLGSISKSFSEAAVIDGANEMQIALKVIFPLVKNVFLTVMLIFFIEYWNDYNMPLLYMPSHPTLAYGVWFLANNTTGDLNVTPRKMAGCMMIVVPITILFIIFKDKLMDNLSMGGVKE